MYFLYTSTLLSALSFEPTAQPSTERFIITKLSIIHVKISASELISFGGFITKTLSIVDVNDHHVYQN